MSEDRDAQGLAQFAFEMGVLKRVRRAGWWHTGIRDPESVAEHSMRVSQLQGWIDSSRRGLRTETAQRIADAALETSPLAWRGR